MNVNTSTVIVVSFESDQFSFRVSCVEFLSSGDLEGVIDRKRQELKSEDAPSLEAFWDEAVQYAIDVAKGMAWLSQRGVRFKLNSEFGGICFSLGLDYSSRSEAWECAVG